MLHQLLEVLVKIQVNEMNLELTDNFQEAIRSIPLHDIKHFFKTCRQEQYERLRAAGQEGNPSLTDIQARVILLDEMEQFFLQTRNPQQTHS